MTFWPISKLSKQSYLLCCKKKAEAKVSKVTWSEEYQHLSSGVWKSTKDLNKFHVMSNDLKLDFWSICPIEH